MRTASATRPERGPQDRQYRKVYGAWRKVPFRIICLSQTPTELWVHYDPFIRKNRPCPEDVECLYCKNHQRRTYKAFVAAERTDTNEVCVADITEHAMSCLEELKVDFKAMRGLSFTMFRKLGHINAPVWIRDLQKHSKPSALQPAFDVLPHLHRLWGWVNANEEYMRRRVEITEAETLLPDGEIVQTGEPPY